MSHQKLQVIVSGCGIGGLVAAIALRRAGHDVTIYEKSSQAHEVGQGIALGPNGTHILDSLGLDFESARMIKGTGRYTLDAITLEPIRDYIDHKKRRTFTKVPYMYAYRINLHAALQELAQSERGEGKPVKIVTSTEVIGYDGEQGVVRFAGGKETKADLVVAADGVKSIAASCLVGENAPTIESHGTIVYRFTLSQEQIRADPSTAVVLDDAEPAASRMYISPDVGRWLIRYRCRDDGLTNFGLYVLRTYEDANGQEDVLRFHTERQNLLDEMKTFHPALRRLAEMSKDVLPLWKCTTREPLPNLHRGRLVVIGDAAHPIKPHMGAGANSAIEDAGVLGELFKDFPCGADVSQEIEQRLKVFDKLRVGRVAVIKYYSDVPFFKSAVEEQRSKCLQWMKPEDLPATQADMIPWYVGYDALTHAEEARKGIHQSNGTC